MPQRLRDRLQVIQVDDGDAIASLGAAQHQVVQHHFQAAPIGEAGKGIMQRMIHQFQLC